MSAPTAPRRFARLRPGPSTEPGYSELPKDGMCLSAFLLVHPAGAPEERILGLVDPAAPWWQLGALEPERLRRVSEDWMLPSSHLIEYETPDEAARRIATEQLEIPTVRLLGPEVHSEAYARTGASAGERHWDLHFLYRAEWPAGRALRAGPFRELRSFRPGELATMKLARGGSDILALATARPG